MPAKLWGQMLSNQEKLLMKLTLFFVINNIHDDHENLKPNRANMPHKWFFPYFQYITHNPTTIIYTITPKSEKSTSALLNFFFYKKKKCIFLWKFGKVLKKGINCTLNLSISYLRWFHFYVKHLLMLTLYHYLGLRILIAQKNNFPVVCFKYPMMQKFSRCSI